MLGYHSNIMFKYHLDVIYHGEKMTRYKLVGKPWRGHRLLVNAVISHIHEKTKRNHLYKLAYRLVNLWQPVSLVDDEAWLDFLNLVEETYKKLKRYDAIAEAFGEFWGGING